MAAESSSKIANPVKVPAPIQKAKDKLTEMGLAITRENIESNLDPAEINKLLGVLRYSLNKAGNEQQKASFKETKDKRSFLAPFLLDPDVSKCEVFNSNKKEITTGTQSRKVWLTLNQLASPVVLNSMEDALLVCSDLPERDHEKPSMAAAGKKQYEYEVTEEVYNNLNKESAELTSNAQVSAADYTTIKAAMEDPVAKRPKIKKEAPPTEAELEKKAAEELMKKTKAAHGLALASLKRTSDKARKLASASCESANKLTSKGYPSEMVTHFVRQVQPLSEAAVKGFDSWTIQSKEDLQHKTPEDIDALRVVIESAQKEVDEAITSSDSIRREITKISK